MGGCGYENYESTLFCNIITSFGMFAEIIICRTKDTTLLMAVAKSGINIPCLLLNIHHMRFGHLSSRLLHSICWWLFTMVWDWLSSNGGKQLNYIGITVHKRDDLIDLKLCYQICFRWKLYTFLHRVISIACKVGGN